MKDDYQKQFVQLFKSMHSRRYSELFRDFVTMSALAIAQSTNFDPLREERYLTVAKQYNPSELDRISQLLSIVVMGLEERPSDFLGTVFGELELGQAQLGQFFTPYAVSKMMAEVTLNGVEEIFKTKPYVTVSEPASGAGSTIIALSESLKERGYNPQKQMWVQCIDVDSMAAYMAYIQLSLLGIPAEVIVGNTLSLNFREHLYTPMHVLGAWDRKLSGSEIRHAETETRYLEPGQQQELFDINTAA
ncbi:SAM-dependent methyltransferase [Vibrio fluvialis]|nr:SAM-dependent methyltransferase [Vibrio fluvialis]